jgi:hypothetical protein
MYYLEECERLQGIEKEAEDSTHNRHIIIIIIIIITVTAIGSSPGGSGTR